MLVLLVRPGHRGQQTDSLVGVVSGSFFNLFRVVFTAGRVFNILEHPPFVELSINQNGLLLLLAAHGSLCCCAC